MMGAIKEFILYNNTFTIVAVLLLLSGGTALANDTVREEVGEALISYDDTVIHQDNSYLLNANIEDFDFQMQVVEVTEDDLNYYVTYEYRTIEIIEGVWQRVDKQDELTISKEFLGDRDLGLYVAEELAELQGAMRVYLTEAQTVEHTIGTQSKTVERRYKGLVGRFLDDKEVTFTGYDPVIEPEEEKPRLAQTPQVRWIEPPDDTQESEMETKDATSSTTTTDPVSTSTTGTTGVGTTTNQTSSSTDNTTATTTTASSTPVVDTIPPVLTLNGSSELMLVAGDTYEEPGAQAVDDVDGDISENIIITGTVDTSAAGTYDIVYRINDAAGNSTEATRTVTVETLPEETATSSEPSSEKESSDIDSVENETATST